MSVICDICGESFKDTRGLAGHKQFKHAAEREEKTESKAVTRPQPLDNVIENLRLPQVPEAFDGQYNVYVAGFNDGVMHGARSILAGIRAAQELSSMGIAQAKPLISMAAEMRQAEGQAARVLASELAETNRAGVDEIKGVVSTLVSSVRSSGPNPLENMVARIAEPMLKMFMDRVTGMFGMGQPGGGQPYLPSGWSYEKSGEEEQNGKR